jgi:hypothetical protein
MIHQTPNILSIDFKTALIDSGTSMANQNQDLNGAAA